MDETKVEELRSLYRESVLAWRAADQNPRAANELFDDNQRLYRSIRDVPEGRAAISALIDDENDAVRLMAASHSLRWDVDRAVAALRALEHVSTLDAVTAKYTLREFFKGTLDLIR